MGAESRAGSIPADFLMGGNFWRVEPVRSSHLTKLKFIFNRIYQEKSRVASSRAVLPDLEAGSAPRRDAVRPLLSKRTVPESGATPAMGRTRAFLSQREFPDGVQRDRQVRGWGSGASKMFRGSGPFRS